MAAAFGQVEVRRLCLLYDCWNECFFSALRDGFALSVTRCCYGRWRVAVCLFFLCTGVDESVEHCQIIREEYQGVTYSELFQILVVL